MKTPTVSQPTACMMDMKPDLCQKLHVQMLTATRAQIQYMSKVISRCMTHSFDILVPETRAQQDSLMIGHPGPNTPPLWCLFCVTDSKLCVEAIWKKHKKKEKEKVCM